jgi:membrane protein implicated in regulation of membrane protease activity
METHFLWLIVGIVLVIAELLTGTFYLLFLGLAALVGAAAAFLGAPLWVQAAVVVVCSLAGVSWVNRYRRSRGERAMPGLDVGQPVTFQAWISQPDRAARVRYRDADWDALVQGDCRGEPGEVLYIAATRGNLLEVAKARPT